MIRYRLKIAERDFSEVQRLVFADLPKEAGAFALAGAAQTGAGADILVRRPISIPKEHFSAQHEHRLEVSSQAINGLVALCEANRLGAILCHSHPRDTPYSPSDDHGEHRIFAALRPFIPAHAPTASLLFFPGGVRGRVWLPSATTPIPLSEIVVVGHQLRRTHTDLAAPTGSEPVDVTDRLVLAFGQEGSALLARTKVGIIGVGGTGSPTAEQLVRLGVKDVMLLDPDVLEPSNLKRVYGTFWSSMRRRWWQLRRSPPLKVDVVAAHLRHINPDAHVEAIPQNVVLRHAVRRLLDRDVIFLCTDDHWGRSIVNAIAYQYLIPTINLGARVAAKNGNISAAVGVVDVLRPDMPCLWCTQFLRAERIAAESTPRRTRKSLVAEGYVEGLETPAPSVVSITTAVSGMAVTLFLHLVTGFMGDGGSIARLNYNVMEGTVRRGTATVSSQCVCTKVRGFGDLIPLHTVEDLSFLDA